MDVGEINVANVSRAFRAVCLFALLFAGPTVYAQYYEERPDPEIGMGVKIVKGTIIYGPKSFYTTDHSSIGLHALFRYDAPVGIASHSPYQKRYIDMVIESGFIFCKAAVFDSLVRDPVTNQLIHERSKNPAYLPVYLGLCTRRTISLGASVFYWKGLGTLDAWGAKFLSLTYNAQNFRVGGSGEWYAQTRHDRHNGLLFTVDFLWKFIVRN